MPANFMSAVQRSFFAKICCWLQNESRNLAEYPGLARSDGVVTFSVPVANYGSGFTTYGIKIIEQGQPLFLPGVNVRFQEQVDLNNISRNLWRMPAVITIGRQIEGNTNPNYLKVEVEDVTATLLNGLKDRKVEIWDFASTDNPDYTGNIGNWHKNRYTFRNDSDPFAVRKTLIVNIDYHDLANY